MWAAGLFAVLLGCSQVDAKAVFAHFMVENAKDWDVNAWTVDIKLAQEAHIDGFALNIRQDDLTLGTSLPTAFKAAEEAGFGLIFSFDYAGGGRWSPTSVIQLTNQYGVSAAYYKDGGKPLVSTFEGPLDANDWEAIKKKTNALFLPDWSSLGAKAALAAAPCIPDGLFSWAPWPWGNTNMDTYVDASYREFLQDATNSCGREMKYMMPASPWFYTNLPGYNKNWMWRGDDLWFDRWEEIRFLNPDYVEIISWNDFGESHHIGPLYVDDGKYEAFEIGKAPFNYAKDMPHDGWRQLLPFVIDLYKNGVASVTEERLVTWYRVNPKQSGCDDGWTTGNTASQLQVEFWPHEIVQDKIFFSALLTQEKPVTVSIGGVDLGAQWSKRPSGGIGIYHGSVEYQGHLGSVIVTVGSMTIQERDIRASCDSTNGYINWNAFVASKAGASVSAEVDTTKWVCIEGTGASGFDELCEFTCKYGYCPDGACYCTKMGPGIDPPGKDTPGFATTGYPAEGKSASYKGLCKFACGYGFCPNAYCGTTEYPLIIPTVSPFTPNACTSGTGTGALEGLCKFACNFGFCPIHSCTCSSTGPLNQPPEAGVQGGTSVEGLDPRVYAALCNFACSRGYCPDGVCRQTDSSDSGNPQHGEIVYIGTEVYATPTAACTSPCVLVLPPSPLASTTTISIPPYTTSLQVGTTSTALTVYPKPIATSRIPFSNVNVTGAVTGGAVFPKCTSIILDDIDVTLTQVKDGKTTITTRALQLPPWPQMTQGPPQGWSSSCGGWVNGTIGGPTSIDDSWTDSTTTTDPPFPTWTQFPPIRVEPVTQDIDPKCSKGYCPGDGKDSSITVKCDELWFFNLCINTKDLKVYGWKFTFPQGTIGPGPPPPSLNLGLAGWGIGTPPHWPPWPKITIGPGPGMTYPDQDSSCDNNKLSVPVELYTRSFGLSVSQGVTLTTATRTLTETVSETGCPVPEWTSTAACSIAAKRTAVPSAAANAGLNHVPRALDPEWENDNSCPGGEEGSVIYYTDDATDEDALLVWNRLKYDEQLFGLRSEEFSHPDEDLGVLMIYVWNMPRSLCEKIGQMLGVSRCYGWASVLVSTYASEATDTTDNEGQQKPNFDDGQNGFFVERAETDPFRHEYAWQRSHISSYPNEAWQFDGINDEGSFDWYYDYYHDDTLGAGQYIYLFEAGITSNDPEFSGANIEIIQGRTDISSSVASIQHGDQLAKVIIGRSIGLVPRATLVTFSGVGMLPGPLRNPQSPYEIKLISLLQMIQHIEANGRQGKCVVNMSFSLRTDRLFATVWEFPRELLKLLKHMERKLQCVLVTSAGNKMTQRYADDTYPQYWQHTGELPNMIVAGATGKHARKSLGSVIWSNHGDSDIDYAPGLRLEIPSIDGKVVPVSGTSISAPLIAGVAAYIRGLQSPWVNDFKDPKIAANMVKYLSRPIHVQEDDDSGPDSPTTGQLDKLEDPNYTPKSIWNGNVLRENCLTGYVTDLARSVCDPFISRLPASLQNWVPDLSIGNSGGGSNGGSGGITWEPGPASPTCTADCGTLCTGFYCVPLPTGTPPDFGDPENQTEATSTTKATTSNPPPVTSTKDEPAPTTTTSATTPDPTPTGPYADCAYWDEGWGWQFEVYNIRGWADDHGQGLHDNENGCGAVTAWTWVDATATTRAKVNFNIDLFLKSGCVERAVKSAGGPELSCVYQGLGKRGGERLSRAAQNVQVLEGPSRVVPPPAPAPERTYVPHTLYRPMNWTEVDAGGELVRKDTSARRRRPRQAPRANIP